MSIAVSSPNGTAKLASTIADLYGDTDAVQAAQNVARQAFRHAVTEVADKAKTVLPDCGGRVESAVKMVLAGDVELHADGTATVASQANSSTEYLVVNGTCPCKDFAQAPSGWCKHRIAAGMQKRAQALMPVAPTVRHCGGCLAVLAEDEATQPGEACRACTSHFTLPTVEAPALRPSGIAPEHIVHIQGKPFVTYAGLLALAHARGLVSLTADWTFNDATLSLAHAVAVFPFGSFQESGDASPDNVTKSVSPHFRRVALTRAKARVLRDALNVDMVSLEELSEGAG